MSPSNPPLDTEYLDCLIGVYVPDAEQYDPRDLVSIAMDRDQAAAEALAISAESQLQLEQAAAVANQTLDEYFETVDWSLFTGIPVQ